MSTNIFVAGIDLDALLLPIGAHAPIANVGVKSNGGVDLSQRFAGAAFGTPFGTTHIFSSNSGPNTDIGQLFAGIPAGPTTIVVTAGTFSPSAGQTYFGFNSNPLVGPNFGSISPTTYKGYVISQLNSFLIAIPSQGQDTFELVTSVNPGSSLFTSIQVGANTRTSATATFSFSGAHATWNWGPISPTTGDLFQTTSPPNVSAVIT